MSRNVEVAHKSREVLGENPRDYIYDEADPPMNHGGQGNPLLHPKGVLSCP